MKRRAIMTGLAAIAAAKCMPAFAQADPLPSWNDGSNKRVILDFVARTAANGGDYVPVPERVACFDNDGTLWSEQPMYFQLAFALDRVKALAPHHPEWKTQQPYKAVLEGDQAALAAMEERSCSRSSPLPMPG